MKAVVAALNQERAQVGSDESFAALVITCLVNHKSYDIPPPECGGLWEPQVWDDRRYDQNCQGCPRRHRHHVHLKVIVMMMIMTMIKMIKMLLLLTMILLLTVPSSSSVPWWLDHCARCPCFIHRVRADNEENLARIVFSHTSYNPPDADADTDPVMTAIVFPPG